MTAVVLGATGMLGHVATLALRREGRRVVAQARTPVGWPAIDDDLRTLDVADRPALTRLLAGAAPCTVINCVGARPGSPSPLLTALNADLPHWLADSLDANGWGRLIHVSTDGVFSPHRGRVTEDAVPDPADDYGRSKLAGEITRAPHLTVRASIIGPELRNRSGLLEWFRSDDKPVVGYAAVQWNGVTTLELARFFGLCIAEDVRGLVHLGGETVTKLELLALMKKIYGVSREVRASGEPCVERTLASYRTFSGYAVPPISVQLEDLHRWESDALTSLRGAGCP